MSMPKRSSRPHPSAKTLFHRRLTTPIGLFATMKDEESSVDQRSCGDEDGSLFDEDEEDDEAPFGNHNTRTNNAVREDIQLMNVIRAIVLLLILTMAVISAEIVFIVTTIHEEGNFVAAYEDVSLKLNENFVGRMDNALWEARSFATGIAESSRGAPWPFVTVSSFNSRCEGPLHLTSASTITFSPRLRARDLSDWEDYATLYYPRSIEGEGEGTAVFDANVTYYPTKRSASDGIYRFENGSAVDADGDYQFLFPVWQSCPFQPTQSNATGLIGALFEETSNHIRASALNLLMNRTGSAISSFLFEDTNFTDLAYYHTPRSNLYYPVLDVASDTSTVVGMIDLQINWETMLQPGVVDYNESTVVVIESSCGGRFSYKINAGDVQYLGPGDVHNKKVDGYAVSNNSSYAQFASLFDVHGEVPITLDESCNYKITAYPSEEFKGKFLTHRPDIYRGIVLVALFFVVALFIAFDAMVERHQRKMLSVAEESDAIVRSLFPEVVADRLYEDARKMELEKQTNLNGNGPLFQSPKSRVKRFMRHPDHITQNTINAEMSNLGSAPIADLFPNTTVLFADLAGFTAWSSEREPAQVFTLLETIYHSMDKIAKRMHVFKVETIGDCYVAATGLPEPQADHAERMARYARKCIVSVSQLTRRLEAHLGPGTADLAMRIGIHSGPVTGGVLRGQKARFQLFGDTMNMASRIEASGVKNKIHLSKDTACLLPNDMVTKREDPVSLKGKGVQETFWLNLGIASSGSYASSDESGSFDDAKLFSTDIAMEGEYWEGTSLEGILGRSKIDSEIDRLIDWNVDVLKPLLKAIIATRAATAKRAQRSLIPVYKDSVDLEVQMIIPFPDFDVDVITRLANQEELKVPPESVEELREYVAAIATGYPKNPFHSFEHCSHVILSATKLLKRIMAPDDVKQESEEGLTSEELHEHTLGIATDPICQFAVVFSALIHDVGHPGVPNGRFAVEKPDIAEKYSNRSIAEKRSIDIAFDLLNLPRFQNLRECIYVSDAERARFRKLVVNSVMATDIFDKDLMALRDSRWNTAFHERTNGPEDAADMHRKATIVVDHIIQASDVAHTMQHFCIYQKWNERLFQEMYFAYLAGRSDKDPSWGWYKGELWFFDNYIIPLAGKLKDCGVFGVSSDEYLHYACQNRHEWEIKGEEIVEAMTIQAKVSAAAREMVQSEIKVFSDKQAIDAAMDGRSLTRTGSLTLTRNASTRTVLAPPGRLGIVLDMPMRGPVRVDFVDEESPLRGLLQRGDCIVSVDGTPTLGMSIEDVGALLSNDDCNRDLVVVARKSVFRSRSIGF